MADDNKREGGFVSLAGGAPQGSTLSSLRVVANL